jgi:hypothetical protein
MTLSISQALKKAVADKEVIMVTSSGGPPPESNQQVSCFCYLPSLATKGESNCMHLGLPSRLESFLFLLHDACCRLPHPFMHDMSKVIRSYLAIEEENKRMVPELAGARHKFLVCMPFCLNSFYYCINGSVDLICRVCCSSYSGCKGQGRCPIRA